MNTFFYNPTQLKISSNTIQETFNREKYTAIAYDSEIGHKLRKQIEEHWSEWVEQVETAPWIRNWMHSNLYNIKGCTPSGKLSKEFIRNHGAKVDGSSIALAVYSIAVWYIGFEGTVKGIKMLKHISKLQKLKAIPKSRAYLWDEKIYRGCGLEIPIEIGELDRWLEQLWTEITVK